MRGVRRFLSLCSVLVAHTAMADVTVTSATVLPGFAELESTGAIIGQIRINPENIFDLDDPAENNAVYRWVNRLHFPTRADVIAKVLLFKSGQRVSLQKINET